MKTVYNLIEEERERNKINNVEKSLSIEKDLTGISDSEISDAETELLDIDLSDEDINIDKEIENIQTQNPTQDTEVRTERTETDDIKDFVTKGYRDILLREPDIGGLNNYIDEIKTKRVTKDRFLEVLKESEEYKERFIEMAKKTKTNPTNSPFSLANPTNPSKRRGINFGAVLPSRKVKFAPAPSEQKQPSSIESLVYCMMGENRLHEIKDYIPTVLPYVDMFVYVDAHSTDGTLEFMKDLSEKNGGKIKIIEKDWEDKFSAFRNHYLDYLRSIGYKGYVACSDTDEHFPIETLSKLRELIKNAKSYTGVAFRAYDVTLDDNDRTKIISESLNPNYHKHLMFRFYPELHYQGEPHETLLGHKINWAQTELIYKHSRSQRKIYERAVENWFISNSNRYSAKWAEFRQLCTNSNILKFKEYWALFTKGELPKEIEDWIWNHRNDNQDAGDSEVKEQAKLYFELLHSEKGKSRSG